jgi:conserved oligomeric Golgi complex subunit 2
VSSPSKGKEKEKAPIPTEGEKVRLAADLTECLRTYDVLGLWRDAEDVIRREVVRAFVKKVCSVRLPQCVNVDTIVVDNIPRCIDSTTFPSRPTYTITRYFPV